MDKQKENFERLVRSHKDTIYTVCYMFSKDEDEVADLFQETLINVWRGLPKYQGGATKPCVDGYTAWRSTLVFRSIAASVVARPCR